MAVMLGKKRRRAEPEDHHEAAESSSDDEATARALFQRAFEAKFKPLDKEALSLQPSEQESDESNDVEAEDDWEGVSGSDDVEVIEVHDSGNAMDQASLSREKKAFMSGRIPTSADPVKATKTKQSDTQDEAEVANLKNDMALQRLLKESHLLDASTYNSTGADVQGKSRLKALDLRIQDLGGKASHLSQKNMPLSHRRGIEAKTVDREQKRRKEASDNGIILERAKFATKNIKPREKGIGGPSVGRFQGGMLKLSGKDVRSIESTRTSVRGRKRGRGR
ncbi:hypothetical protein AMS68_004166 [Peltaster fructicola]|uniref:Protein FAF1 n=1 Tax=Peltaster fructicola TaxID=286661 RepID=A0A6H0XVK5_9PEZI|nr:hypothetical protein AMS68_004166 [Peltaster fructicola]